MTLQQRYQLIIDQVGFQRTNTESLYALYLI